MCIRDRGVVFQLAHINGDTTYPEPVGSPRHIENEWGVHQVQTTADFAPHNWVLNLYICLLYTSDAADDLLCVDLGGRRIIKKKKKTHTDGKQTHNSTTGMYLSNKSIQHKHQFNEHDTKRSL